MFPVLAALAGLLTGSALAPLIPRLVAYRFPRERRPRPVAAIPLIGPSLDRWDPFPALSLQVGCAIVAGALAWHFGPGLRFLIAALDSIFLLLIAAIDLHYRIVPNRLSYPATLAALALSPFGPGPVAALEGAAVCLVVFAALFLISRGNLGLGDVKLAVVIGAMLGMPAALSALGFGIVLAGLAAAIMLTVMRSGMKATFAYAPYLSCGAIALLLTGH